MLDKFFNPQSVAVIGASREPGKLGRAVVDNLIECGYTDDHNVYPINPKAGEILGIKAYSSVLDISDPIDLAIVVIPYQYVPGALRECGKKGIPAVVIITAGFREAGHEGLLREQEIIQIAKEFNIRIIGPNCLGIIDTFTPLNASFAAGTPPQGPMNFTSQSGALGTAVLDWAIAGRLGFSKFVSLGNKADINEIDLFRHWAEDPHCNVIMAYIEGVPDGQQFMEAAREIGKKKPIVAVKSGVTQSGSRAVSSHTGSLAGSEQAYSAAFKQAGIVRADTMEEMFDFSLAFAYQPPLPGDRIAVITNAGGPGILATDAIERCGLSLAKLDNETIQTLTSYLPDAASAANPVDVLGDAMADRYEFALEQVAKDPNVDGMLVILTPQAMTNIKGTAEAIAALSDQLDRPILTSFMGEARANEGIDILTKRGVPNYSFPERAVSAFKAMSLYRKAKALPLPQYKKFKVDQKAVQAVFDKARSEDRVSIGDFEAREILTAYGLSIPGAELADTADKAVEIANDIGYPVVLKIASPDILHKTDVGGVKVGLSNAQDVRDAFDLIVYRAQRYVPNARIWGCVVQQMVQQGLEVLVGMNRDPQFGPLVTFALGGIYVEILKDATFRIAPFAPDEAQQMLGELRARALLDGVRGKPPVDKEAIVDTLLRIGQLVTDFPEIVELDINPLMVFEQSQGAAAIDMRLILK
ncbi:MAG: acetate--CoA ligase family protein [Anaerolineae bacterium]|nr:acetate--CoA ligase family protein [Anaerolineae bacterium]